MQNGEKLDFFNEVPSIKEFKAYDGQEPTAYFKGGEIEGILKMNNYFKNIEKTATFQKPMTNPTSIIPDTTALSPYIKFGSLSSRTFYYEVLEVYKKYKGAHSKPPESLIGQFYFREWFYLAAYVTKNFDKMKGNPDCK